MNKKKTNNPAKKKREKHKTVQKRKSKWPINQNKYAKTWNLTRNQRNEN